MKVELKHYLTAQIFSYLSVLFLHSSVGPLSLPLNPDLRSQRYICSDVTSAASLPGFSSPTETYFSLTIYAA